jgi:predicted kinase
MKKPILILVTGLPATGKSTLARKIAEKFNLPLLTKDELKELFSDALNVTDPESSNRFGVLARALLPFLAEKFLRANQSIILESNFNKKALDEPVLRRILEETDSDIIQVVCQAPGDLLFERFKKRVVEGKRHKIHPENSVKAEEFNWVFSSGHATPLDLKGEVIEINTTNFETIDYDRLFLLIKKCLRD